MNKYLKQYLETVKATKAANTYKTYKNCLLKAWFPLKYNLTLEYITSQLANFDCSTNTKASRCIILLQYVNYINSLKPVQNYKTISSLLKSVKKEEKLPECASLTQYQQVIDCAANLKIQLAIDLMFQNGLRESEVLGLKIEDIDIANKKVIISNRKNNADHCIYLTDKILAKIQNIIGKRASGYLLETRNRTPLDAGYLRKEIKNACTKAGFPLLHAHSFRHGSATYLLDNNVDLVTIQQHLGQKSLQSTQKYLHISSKQKEKVKNIFEDIA